MSKKGERGNMSTTNCLRTKNITGPCESCGMTTGLFATDPAHIFGPSLRLFCACCCPACRYTAEKKPVIRHQTGIDVPTPCPDRGGLLWF